MCGTARGRAGSTSGAAEADPVSHGGGSVATSSSRVQSAAIGSKRAGSTGTGCHPPHPHRARSGCAPRGSAPASPRSHPRRRSTPRRRSWPTPWCARTSAAARSAATRSAAASTESRAAARASAPNCGQEFSFTPKLQARRPGRRAVRGGGRARPRWSRLDLPGPRPQRLQPLGGAQGPAQLRRPRRARGGDRRAAVPRPGRAPGDRRDLQLRHPRGCRLHRDGVRRRQVAQADPQGPDAGQQRGLRPAAGRPGARLHPRAAAGVPVPARPRPDLLRLQARQHDPGRRRDEADRPRRRPTGRRPGVRDLRHGRLPGARGGRGRADGGLRHLHDRPHPAGAHAWSSAATRAPTCTACRRSTRRRCSSSTTRSTTWSPSAARPIRPTGSRPSTSCAPSCSACCARSSPAPGRVRRSPPRRRSCSSRPATARPITELEPAAPAARGHHRPAVRLAVHDRCRGARGSG